jgi:uncharacterized protein (DUF2252 family)
MPTKRAARLTAVPGLPSPHLAALLSVSERLKQGKALRARTPREAQADWSPPRRRRDPVDLLIETGKPRIPELLPIRYGRMAQSPFTFLRGAAAVMAADLATTATTGLRVQACGDCHLGNFGAYLSAEGTPVFDINDFDETLPAPFEWDLKRLAASVFVASRNAGLGDRTATRLARKTARSYRQHMAELVPLSPLEAWRTKIDLAECIGSIRDPVLRGRLEKRLGSPGRDRDDQLYRAERDKKKKSAWRLRDKPPLVYHFKTDRDDVHALAAKRAFDDYRLTLQEDRRILADRYRLVDTAFKVVGVGSVGTFCAVGLFMTRDDEPLFLQIKEALPSVLAPYAGASAYDNQGQRVVTGQRLLQATTDVFLGWTRDADDNRHFYVRQLKDKHLARIGETMEEEGLSFYAQLCGHTLARAHARSGDAALITGYIGSGEVFDDAIASFAAAYADQTTRDYAAFMEAIAEGRLVAQKEAF